MNSTPIQNAYRFCPRCGTPSSDVGSIPFRCSSCELKLFLGPVAAVGGLIVNEQDQLLLVRRARNPGRGLWGLPGGFVDRNETVEHALRREIREETNLVVDEVRYLLSRTNQYAYGGATSPVIDMFFICEARSIETLTLAKDELDFHLWTRPTSSQLDNMAFESNRIAVESWLARTG